MQTAWIFRNRDGLKFYLRLDNRGDKVYYLLMNTKSSKQNSFGQRTPPSTKVFMFIEVTAAAIADLLMIVCLAIFNFNGELAVTLLALFFYPSVIAVALALTIGVAQQLRNRSFIHLVAIILAIVAIALLGANVAREQLTYGIFYLPPWSTLV